MNEQARQQILVAIDSGIQDAYNFIRNSMLNPGISSIEYVAGGYIADFPTLSSMSSAISRMRRRSELPLPASTADINIPFEHKYLQCPTEC